MFGTKITKKEHIKYFSYALINVFYATGWKCSIKYVILQSNTHIEELCDRVVWLEHGKIIKVGNTKEICREYYKKQLNKD